MSLIGHHVLEELGQLGDWFGLFDDQETSRQVILSLHVNGVQFTGQPTGGEHDVDLVVEKSGQLAAFVQLFGKPLHVF